MKRAITVFAIATVLLGAGLVSRAIAASEETLTPTFVGCLENGECFFGVSPAISASNTTCASRSQVRFNMSQPGSESIFRTVLSAKLAGKPVTVKVTNNCLATFPRPEYVHASF